LNQLIKVLILSFLLSQSSFALGAKYYQEKFNTTKKLYLGAIMSNDKKQEIKYLKQLVNYGDKLDVDTLKYRKELQRLDKSVILTNSPPKKSSTVKKTTKAKQTKSKYNITSVKQTNNSIIINFSHNISKNYIDFNEKKVKTQYIDEFLIKGNFKDASPTKLAIKGVDRIVIFQQKYNQLTLHLKDRHNLKTIYIINKKQIIIKVIESGAKASTKSNVTNTKQSYFRQKTIVIDPGHGGKDPGASYKKRYEKNVTLNIGKYLKTDLEKRGFKVYLTRSKDKFIKLSHRTQYANKKDADIFVSIHANAASKSRAAKAHGVEAYFLSPARSARAKRVAALENKGEMTGMGWSSKDSLLTILNQAKITAANKMAIDIQKNMLYTLRKTYGTSAIRDGGVREGPFWVLVGAQMPSVLVEIGYITHPKEGYRISTTKYQKIVASGIADGIESYFLKN